ncbi:hypothetical protein VOLCADRAFT_88728 [Volvox carteri f. nagariensis]|uniref:Uncharacterized protein n=1 Tax=Volvox carteri f. nagariensis TaxID=3068 RepID=D8TPT1_VOLCA|nr:uncharacterized protein VOLCADRAFT_88728 [Volvox carteri f. nagariensis]EFJ50411.1 hypothetical protein VOLCADRAFT_88728 [Volvox carteri f. nagariensis]|eukprot:XP_002948536.1 hypothetical protein VOLCADRAFT_88728 [Volvox carteri f. nagariensis]
MQSVTFHSVLAKDSVPVKVLRGYGGPRKVFGQYRSLVRGPLRKENLGDMGSGLPQYLLPYRMTRNPQDRWSTEHLVQIVSVQPGPDRADGNLVVLDDESMREVCEHCEQHGWRLDGDDALADSEDAGRQARPKKAGLEKPCRPRQHKIEDRAPTEAIRAVDAAPQIGWRRLVTITQLLQQKVHGYRLLGAPLLAATNHANLMELGKLLGQANARCAAPMTVDFYGQPCNLLSDEPEVIANCIGIQNTDHTVSRLWETCTASMSGDDPQYRLPTGTLVLPLLGEASFPLTMLSMGNGELKTSGGCFLDMEGTHIHAALPAGSPYGTNVQLALTPLDATNAYNRPMSATGLAIAAARGGNVNETLCSAYLYEERRDSLKVLRKQVILAIATACQVAPPNPLRAPSPLKAKVPTPMGPTRNDLLALDGDDEDWDAALPNLGRNLMEDMDQAAMEVSTLANPNTLKVATNSLRNKACEPQCHDGPLMVRLGKTSMPSCPPQSSIRKNVSAPLPAPRPPRFEPCDPTAKKAQGLGMPVEPGQPANEKISQEQDAATLGYCEREHGRDASWEIGSASQNNAGTIWMIPFRKSDPSGDAGPPWHMQPKDGLGCGPTDKTARDACNVGTRCVPHDLKGEDVTSVVHLYDDWECGRMACRKTRHAGVNDAPDSRTDTQGIFSVKEMRCSIAWQSDVCDSIKGWIGGEHKPVSSAGNTPARRQLWTLAYWFHVAYPLHHLQHIACMFSMISNCWPRHVGGISPGNEGNGRQCTLAGMLTSRKATSEPAATDILRRKSRYLGHRAAPVKVQAYFSQHHHLPTSETPAPWPFLHGRKGTLKPTPPPRVQQPATLLPAVNCGLWHIGSMWPILYIIFSILLQPATLLPAVNPQCQVHAMSTNKIDAVGVPPGLERPHIPNADIVWLTDACGDFKSWAYALQGSTTVICFFLQHT